MQSNATRLQGLAPYNYYYCITVGAHVHEHVQVYTVYTLYST